MGQPTLEQRRLALDTEFRELLHTTNTYFEPPSNVRMSYPCVLYSRSNIDELRADDRRYIGRSRFSVTTISLDPDCEWPQLILDHFPYCRYDRQYNADGLSHTALLLYY